MTAGPIQPGKILENFISLLDETEGASVPSFGDENTPTFHGQELESKFSKENPQQKKLTEKQQRPISKIWRN